ncbi:MAG: hypothetical protein HYX69_21525 [Planctomycetia bacterium]|nr:hypothetical protein [Planctomycetia bacterium]
MEIVIIVIFAALLVAAGIWQYYQGERRRKELMALALKNGWQLRVSNDYDIETRFAAFSCLEQGSERYAYNILEGLAQRRPLCGFDYHYETYSTDSKGNRSTHHHYFSALVVETGLPLKPLLIRSENVLDKLGEFFGVDDIDFESAEFSRQFFVKADDRRFAFDVIHQATMEFLLAAPRFTIQFAGSRVMAWRAALFEAIDFEQAVQVISGVVDRLPEYLIREMKGAE